VLEEMQLTSIGKIKPNQAHFSIPIKDYCVAIGAALLVVHS